MTPHDETTGGRDRDLEDESGVGGEFLVNESTDPARSEEPTRGAIWTAGPRQVDGPAVGPSAGIGLAGLAMCGALSLLMGGAGAWAYMSFLADRPPVVGSAASASDEPTGPDSNALAARLDDLSGRVDGLRRDLDAKPTPPMPDFGPLMERVAKLEAATSAVDSLSRKLDESSAGVDANRREIQSNRESLDKVQELVAELQKSATSAKADGGAATESVVGGRPEAEGSADSAIEPGLADFRQRRYREAFDAFQGLTAARPDDARVWYLAALSRGFSTGEWTGETERMARRGAEREKAGTPARPRIDAALEGLTKDTGKDWIAYFRAQGR